MFDEICTRILSPPKFKYSMYDLGSTITKHGKRTDFIVYNTKKHKMNCSLYQPHQIKHHRKCVVYLHSMNGSRLQGLMYAQMLLQQGISYCTFDFSGCGNSDGQKISFGASQKYDVEVVIKKLKQTFYLNRFILWGRSMGAVAAVKYAELCYDKSKLGMSYQQQQIIGMVLDSPFKSLSQLLVEIGHTQTQIPRFLIKAGYLLIKNALEQNGQFKIHELDLIDPDGVMATVGQNNDISNNNSNNQNTSFSSIDQKQQQSKYPLQKLHHLHLPILFLASKQDKTVPCQHSVDMFNSYNSKMKQIGFFKGLHNQSREEDYLERAVGFVRRVVGDDINVDDFEKVKKFYVNQAQLKSLSSRSNVCSNNINMKGNINNNKDRNNNNNSTIPDPLNLQQPPIKKPSLIELIQQRFFKPTQQQVNGGTQTLLQAQTIQSSCVCTMFDNNYINNFNNQNNNNINTFQQTSREKYTTSRSYRQQQEQYNNKESHNKNIYNNNHKQTKFSKDIQLKNYNWTVNNNNRSNHFIETNKSFVNNNNYFNCDRRISLNSHSNNLKLLGASKNYQQKQLHEEDCMVNYRQNLFSSKEIKQAIKYNELNLPLRTVSEKNLRQGSGAGERYFYG